MSRINVEILLGIIIVLLTGGMLLAYGINEQARMDEYKVAQAASSIEAGAAIFDNNCKGCHGVQGEGVAGLCPPLNDRYFFTERMKEVGWTGTLRIIFFYRCRRSPGLHPPRAVPRRWQACHAILG
jgi:hypothetical protein